MYIGTHMYRDVYIHIFYLISRPHFAAICCYFVAIIAGF